MKRLNKLMGMVLLAAGLSAPVTGQEKAAPEVLALIEQLGSADELQREEAKQILSLMPKAFAAVKDASMNHGNIEVQLMSQKILEALKVSRYKLVKHWKNLNTPGALVTGFAISPDRKTFFTRCSEKVLFRDLETGMVKRVLEAPCPRLWGGWRDNAPVYFLECSPDGKTMVRSDSRGRFYFHDVESGEETRNLGVSSTVRPVSSKSLLWHGRYFPKSRKFATSSDGGIIDIWDLEKGELIQSLPQVSKNRGLSFEISPDEKYLIAAFGQDQPFGEVFLWSFEKSKWSTPQVGQMATSARFNADGSKVLVTGARGEAYLFALKEGELIREKLYSGLGNYVSNALFCPGEKTAVLGTENPAGELVEIDLETGEELWRAATSVGKTAERLAWLDQQRLIALHASGDVVIWERSQ